MQRDQKTSGGSMEQVLANSRGITWATAVRYTSQISASLLFFFLPISTTLTSLCFFSTLGLVLCLGDLRSKFKLIFSEPVVWIMGLFFLMFFLGTFYSHADSAAQLSTIKRYSRYFFCIFLLPVFLSERVRYLALQAFLAAGVLTLILVFLKAMNLVVLRANTDMFTIFKTHIDTGFALVMSAYLALLFSERTSNKLLKYFYWIFTLLVIFATFYLGYSRSVYLVISGLALLFTYQSYGRRSALALSAFLPFFFGFVFLTSPVFKEQFVTASQGYHQFQQVGDKTNMSAGIRANFYETGLRAVKQHWFFGTGTGSINYAMSTIDKNLPTRVNNLHNEYLNILVQFGVLGLVLLLALFYSVWRMSLGLSPYYKRLMQAVLLSTILGSLLNSWLMDSVEGYFFGLILVLCLASRIEEKTLATFGHSHESGNSF